MVITGKHKTTISQEVEIPFKLVINGETETNKNMMLIGFIVGIIVLVVALMFIGKYIGGSTSATSGISAPPAAAAQQLSPAASENEKRISKLEVKTNELAEKIQGTNKEVSSLRSESANNFNELKELLKQNAQSAKQSAEVDCESFDCLND